MEEVSERTSLDFSMACSSSALRRISLDFSWDSWRMNAVIFLSSVATCELEKKGILSIEIVAGKFIGCGGGDVLTWSSDMA